VIGDSIGAIPRGADPPIPRNPDRPARYALQRVPVEARQVDLLGRVAASSARNMRPTRATFRRLNPLGSAASKYRLSARLRKPRITGGNVMLQPANVKCPLYAPLDWLVTTTNRLLLGG
jgi:hypothetical protein